LHHNQLSRSPPHRSPFVIKEAVPGLSSTIHHIQMSLTAAAFQRGFAKLIAQNVNHHTRLTHVSHRAPTRLLPLTGSSLLEASGKAQCALSNYGGGMVQGDESIVTLLVEEGASLGVTTQGPNRIYKGRADAKNATPTSKMCKTVVTATVGDRGFLVLAPDPTVLFARSNYEQLTELRLQTPASSCIAMDWFAAGRVQNGEEWSLDSFSTTTKIYCGNEEGTYSDPPILVDRIRLPTQSQANSSSSSETQYSTNFWGSQTLCSIILAGPQSLPVVHQLQAWSSQLTAQVTSVRNLHKDSNATDGIIPTSSLGPNVIVSVSEVQPDQLYVARIAAQSNEDVYRVLHDSLLPLDFGVPFYKDRVASSVTLSRTQKISTASETPAITTAMSTHPGPTPEDTPLVQASGALFPRISNGIEEQNTTTQSTVQISRNDNMMTDQNLWSAFVMMDSCLPTGSFAHSSGIEVAQQFGFLQDDDHVEAYVTAATHSALQLATPYMVAGMKAATANADDLTTAWQELDQSVHSLMVSNSPACQASMDQGRGLLRVALAWSQKQRLQQQSPTNRDAYTKLRSIQNTLAHQHGHLAPLFGIVTPLLLGISNPQIARQMLAYSMARDMVSAAVRLNVIGPLASIGILDRIHRSQQREHETWTGSSSSLDDASSSTPILDVLHPCHDLLAVRLFRT
jgi:urease accessory protein UreH/urease accessory protein UreF